MLLKTPTLQAKTAASVATPAVGEVTLFVDSANGHLSQKDSSGAVTDLAAGGAASTDFKQLLAFAQVFG